MTTTPLPRWKFERVIDGIPCVPTIEADQARADLEAENARLREALQVLVDNGGIGPEWMFDDARAALEKQP